MMYLLAVPGLLSPLLHIASERHLDLQMQVLALGAIAAAVVAAFVGVFWGGAGDPDRQALRRARGRSVLLWDEAPTDPAAGAEAATVPEGPRTVLREVGGAGRTFALGDGPAVVGSSARLCGIVLAGEGVAPEHARIWRQDGRYLLEHVGGLGSTTYVGGEEAAWVALKPGDEVVVGPHRLFFDDRGAG